MRRRSLLRSFPPLAVLAGSGALLVGCGGGSADPTAPPASAPAPAPAPAPPQALRTFVYVANQGSGDVSVFEIDAAGAHLPVGRVPAGAGAASVEIHPSGRFAYVVNETDESISAYAVDAGSGMLSSRVDVEGASAFGQMRIHPSGAFAYVTHPNAQAIVVHAIDAAGRLGVPRLVDFDGLPWRMAIHPGGRSLFVAGLDETVSSYAIEPGTGELSFVAVLPSRPGPNGLAVTPSGTFLYLATEAGAVEIHAVGAGGALAEPAFVDTQAVVHDLVVDPASRLVHALLRDQAGNRIASYRVEASGGLSLEGSVPTGEVPERASLAISPSGRYLFRTNPAQDTLSVYDLGTGVAQERGAPVATGAGPAGIGVLEVPA